MAAGELLRHQGHSASVQVVTQVMQECVLRMDLVTMALQQQWDAQQQRKQHQRQRRHGIGSEVPYASIALCSAAVAKVIQTSFDRVPDR